MCRALAYLGKPISTHALLFGSDSALVHQVFQPKMLEALNLGGFGMVGWDGDSHDPEIPWSYRSTGLPVFDANLRALSKKIACGNLLAHIRGVALEGVAGVNEQNLHPFRLPEASLSMAHNGDLYRFDEMRYSLVPFIRDEILRLVRGTTDSEWIYALLMSRFKDYKAVHSSESITSAVQETLAILREVREQHGIDISSSVNLFVSGPDCMVAARFAFDYGCYPLSEEEAVYQGCIDYLSLWFTQGSDYAVHDGEWKMVGGKGPAESILIASEPLSLDTSTWVEVPEYHVLAVDLTASGVITNLVPLN